MVRSHVRRNFVKAEKNRITEGIWAFKGSIFWGMRHIADSVRVDDLNLANFLKRKAIAERVL